MNSNPSHCPLCGKNNACSQVQGSIDSGCWCFTASIPKALLAQIPESERRDSCICRDCVEKYRLANPSD